ncbi:MAG: hypothetical protein GTO18_09160 [Anaerolineales bacterium]|nr:hypothetical protein [Anaerolineales bacterium]
MRNPYDDVKYELRLRDSSLATLRLARNDILPLCVILRSDMSAANEATKNLVFGIDETNKPDNEILRSVSPRSE